MFSFCLFNKLSDNVIDHRNCHQEEKSDYHEALHSVRDRKRYAPEHISDDQKEQRPDERGNKLDAKKMPEGDFEKAEDYEG